MLEHPLTPSVNATPEPIRPPSYERPKTDCRKVKCVALTFDDGPGPYTERLLNMLAKAHAQATFFVMGPNAEHFSQDLLREAEDGHEIGDHTQHHLELTRYSPQVIHKEVDGTRQVLKRMLGYEPTLFRPPYGATNKRVEKEAGQDHMAVILWSVDTLDWRDRNSSIVARRAIRGLRPGAIILMHDIHPTTVAAVPRILQAAKSKGLTLATVTDVLEGLPGPGGGTPKPGKKYFGR